MHPRSAQVQNRSSALRCDSRIFIPGNQLRPQNQWPTNVSRPISFADISRMLRMSVAIGRRTWSWAQTMGSASLTCVVVVKPIGCSVSVLDAQVLSVARSSSDITQPITLLAVSTPSLLSSQNTVGPCICALVPATYSDIFPAGH
jgi:hypothetical protein